MRDCKIKFTGRLGKPDFKLEKFHQWGTRAVEADNLKDNLIPETIAIVEMEDGAIRVVEPEMVFFLDHAPMD